jgi:hypothetical protein
MSRFANPSASDVLELPGGCQCPGKPHDADRWVYRTELGEGEEKRAGAYGWASTNGSYFDWEAARDKLIEIASIRWNLVDEQNDPVPCRVATVRLLDEDTRDAMAKAVDDAVARFRAESPPNASAVRSPKRSRVNGSRTLTAKTAR